MVANKNFDSILCSVRSSCLNYSIQVSPFSATISLKKTIVKDKTGAYRIPPPIYEHENSDLQNINDALENELSSLKSKYGELLSVYVSTKDNLTLLQESIKDRDNLIRNLIATKKTDEMLVEGLQVELSQKEATIKKDISCTFEEHANEVISWKQDLDNAMNNHKIWEYKYRNLLDKYEHSTNSPRIAELMPPSKTFQHSSSTSFLDSSLEAAGICYDEETTLYAPGHCSCSENCAEVDVISNSMSGEPPSSFVSHSIASIEPPYSNFYCIPSLTPHVVRLLDPWKEALGKNDIFRKLEMRYEEDRETCKQS